MVSGVTLFPRLIPLTRSQNINFDDLSWLFCEWSTLIVCTNMIILIVPNYFKYYAFMGFHFFREYLSSSNYSDKL